MQTYLSAVDSVRRGLESHTDDLSNVYHGLALVQAGWRLHAGAADAGWDVLGVAVQRVIEDFNHLPPVAYTVIADGDPTAAWRQTVVLVQDLAQLLDDVASDPGVERDRMWWAATVAARLRAGVTPVSS